MRRLLYSGMEILRDRSRFMLVCLKRPTLIMSKRFNMNSCSHGDAPIVKRDKFSKSQYPMNDLEKESMKQNPYIFAIGSLMMHKTALCLI